MEHNNVTFDSRGNTFKTKENKTYLKDYRL